MFRRILSLAVIAAGAAVLGAPALAQTASTNVTLRVPSFVMLYHRSQVTFDINDTVMSTLVGESGTTASEGAVTLTDFNGDANVDGVSTGFTPLGSVTATISNFWGVRSLASVASTGTEVSVAFGTATLGNGTDTVSMSGLETRTTSGTFSSAPVVFTPTGLGAGALQRGDVRFQLDLSSVTTSGDYTGGTIEVTAQNL